MAGVHLKELLVKSSTQEEEGWCVNRTQDLRWTSACGPALLSAQLLAHPHMCLAVAHAPHFPVHDTHSTSHV